MCRKAFAKRKPLLKNAVVSVDVDTQTGREFNIQVHANPDWEFVALWENVEELRQVEEYRRVIESLDFDQDVGESQEHTNSNNNNNNNNSNQ